MSISPGVTTRPRGNSTTRASAAGNPRPIFATRSPSINTSNSPLRLAAGSTRCMPFSSSFMKLRSLFRFAAREQVQDSHAYSHAVGDLIEDDRPRTIGDGRVDFDAAIHRPRVHHDHVVSRTLEALRREAEQREVLAH